ncbi:MAG TPA: fused response regulator/phosphatase [Chthoniobacterales bacterium]|jgi:sigma-B regulation protein RsbU (phosphoserine phosphatase)|nr:fused response regulator/phosphatase [Chthoniobacterales bacterium]
MVREKEEILVIDDDRASRRMLVRALADAGYDCREASGGVEALEMLHAAAPSLLLLDFHMPGLNGAEVLGRLRADEDPAIAQLPAIMLTGDGGEESEVRGLEAGANDFVTKPINLPVLRARIETQLRLQSLRRQLQKQNTELEAWRENLERDLAAARLTQQSLIPQKPPTLPGWEVAAVYRPVIQVGGDLYGWLRMRDQRTLFWIVDATGHGAAAALLTTLAKLLFHHGSVEHARPAQIMEAVNNDFRSIFGARSFMTAMCVALDAERGRASVVGAGHPPLVVIRAAGAAELIASNAPPLGLLERSQFEETAIDLQGGDGFVLYTDGLCGHSRNGGEPWTPERLRTLLTNERGSAQGLLQKVLERIGPGEEAPLADDLAALVVRRMDS